MKNTKVYLSQGYSVVEVVLAAAMFMLFATVAITVVLQGFDANRLGGEETIANQYAAEGIEAAKSIKNQAYSNLTSLTSADRGITRNASNVWAFLGDTTNNVLNSGKNYTRTIKVESVLRDGSGNIVSTGGTNDPDTKKITSTVSWSFNSARPESIVLSTYLTDWRRPIIRGGIIVYGDTTTTPKTRNYDVTSNSFSAQSSTILGTSGLTFQIRISPTKQEAIAGYVNSSGVLQIMCYNGTTWTNEWPTPPTVGGTGTTRRFDIAYETNSGDVMVLYSTNVATTNELAYRTKLGSTGCGTANWAGATNLDPVRTSGIVQWVKMAWDRRSSSNLITAIWADGNSDLSAMVWSGTSWGNEPSAALTTTLGVASAAQDVDSFDVEYESLFGDIMVVWSNSGSGATGLLNYKVCTGGTSTCTWGTTTAIPTVADAGTNLDISANPNTDEIVMGAIDNGTGDLSLAYWSGSAWTGSLNVDTTVHCPVAGDHLISTGWLINGSTTRSIIVYHDATSSTCTTATTNVGYYIGNGSSFSVGADFTPTPLFGTQKWYDIQMDPFNKDQLMFTLSDVNNDLFAKRLVMTAVPAFTWSNTEPGGIALQTNLGQPISSPFSFAYWRQP